MGKITILVVSVYIGGILLSFIGGSQWAFYLYQIVYFLNPDNRWWSGALPNLPYSKITVIILIVTYLFRIQQFKINSITNIPYIKYLFMLIFIYGVTYFYAINQQIHYEFMIEYYKMFIILFLGYKVLDSIQKIEYALITMIVGALYIGYEAMSVGRNAQGRVEGIGVIDAPEANGTAALLVPIIPLLIFYVMRGSVKLKILALISGVFIVNGLVLINSRGAFMGVAVSSLLYIWFIFTSKHRAKNQTLILLLLISIGLLGAYRLMDQTFIDRMLTLNKIEDGDKSGSHRIDFWIAAIEVAKDNPLGVGARGFESLSRIYLSDKYFKFAGVKAVHSIWFQALTEVGWFGFTLFLIIIIKVYFMINKIIEYFKDSNDIYYYYLSYAFKFSYVGLLITSSFINQFRVQMIYWLIMLSSALYSVTIRKNEIKTL